MLDIEIIETLGKKIGVEIPKCDLDAIGESSPAYASGHPSSDVIALNLSGLGLTVFPSEIPKLIHLRHLNLIGNQLTELPASIGELQSLERLELDKNELTSIPPEIGSLAGLRKLFLWGNRITRLPRELGRLPMLESLNAFQNPIEYPPQDVLLGGVEKVLAFLAGESIEAGQERPPEGDAVSLGAGSDVATTRSPDPPPLVTFDGWLKHVDVGDLNEIARLAMDIAFPGFRVLESPTDEMTRGMAELRRRGVDYVSWRPRPNRRYAGAEDLPRGRYSTTVARGPQEGDNGTLFRELLAYHDPRASGLVLLADLATQEGVEMLSQMAAGVELENAFAIVFIGRPGARNAFISALSPQERGLYGIGDQDSDRTVALVEIPYGITHAKIENTVDLRLPEVQSWFFQTFGAADTEYYRKADRSGASSFVRLLPSLLSHELGGNDFTDAVGVWLRTHGVTALVYPSARSDCGVRVESGRVADFYGWNLVDYRNAPFPRQDIDTFIDVAAGWPRELGQGVRIVEAGGDLAGSWRVTGLEAWCQSILDSREQEFLNFSGPRATS